MDRQRHGARKSNAKKKRKVALLVYRLPKGTAKGDSRRKTALYTKKRACPDRRKREEKKNNGPGESEVKKANGSEKGQLEED